jgi:peptidoglycan hydrolase CwlO-like protein
MVSKPPTTRELVQKRIQAEIKRLESMIENQELEIMETHDKVRRLEKNIEASRKEIANQESNLAATESATYEEEE